MSNVPCFICNTGKRLKGHVVCATCHKPLLCERCIRSDDLESRMRKRRNTIAANRGSI